jgi:hypothetical protein
MPEFVVQIGMKCARKIREKGKLHQFLWFADFCKE